MFLLGGGGGGAKAEGPESCLECVQKARGPICCFQWTALSLSVTNNLADVFGV